MSYKKLLMVLLSLLIALLAACTPAADEGAGGEAAETPAMDDADDGVDDTDDTDDDDASSAITAAATAHLAGELGISEGQIEVVSAEQTEFTDSCLGLGQANESCLQAMTPGWLVTLRADGVEYVLHTDETGEQVRVAPEMQGAADPAAAEAAAVAHLAGELGVPESDVQMVALEAAEFSDGCLGLGGPEESCLQAITPGFLITLSAGGQEYEVHTDAIGAQVRVAGDMQ